VTGSVLPGFLVGRSPVICEPVRCVGDCMGSHLRCRTPHGAVRLGACHGVALADARAQAPSGVDPGLRSRCSLRLGASLCETPCALFALPCRFQGSPFLQPCCPRACRVAVGDGLRGFVAARLGGFAAGAAREGLLRSRVGSLRDGVGRFATGWVAARRGESPAVTGWVASRAGCDFFQLAFEGTRLSNPADGSVDTWLTSRRSQESVAGSVSYPIGVSAGSFRGTANAIPSNSHHQQRSIETA
jgi:hypothetical protein